MAEMFSTGHSYFVRKKKSGKYLLVQKSGRTGGLLIHSARPPAINRYVSWQYFSCAPRAKKNVKFGLFILRLILSLKTFSGE